ncbi:MAG TPA: IS3 family transposase [Oligoflexus sp.]|uniref:IS3 family transposase n=1 Tax=Oligoflexus sp. TaxID=1971216 RepID=UPI002D3E8106|nr:IS3 family transposase [Oligoflexus sp.]HYX38594.1 IS3 family transposase [Oligoflexus sp.]
MKAQAETYPVQLLCDVLEVSRSCYYEWLQAIPSKRVEANKLLRDAVHTVHEASRGTYGRRRIAAQIAKQGPAVSPTRIERRMKELGIQGISPRAFVTTTRDNTKLVNSPNLIKGEDLEAKTIDQIWVSDITFIPTKEGWLYLCIVLDLYSRRIVGWDMQSNMKADLVINALRMALKGRKPAAGLIFHSDCGGQYKAGRFRGLLRRYRVRQSMTFAGNCYDNATAEAASARIFKKLTLQYPTH